MLRGSAFVAHAVPNGSFAGAAGASLIGVNAIVGLGVFSLAGALGTGLLGRRGRHDVATALTLVFMLGLGALFLSFSVEYAPEIYSLLFGEVLGVSNNELAPSLMIGPPAAARSFTSRPHVAIALSIMIAVAVVWIAIAISYNTNWPVGFFVGASRATSYALGRGWTSWQRHRQAQRTAST